MVMLRTFGGLALEGTDLSRPQPLLLLTYLRLAGPVTREHVAQLFWPNAGRGRKNLSMALVRLRPHAAPGIHDEGEMLASDLPCDADRFLQACGRGQPAEALAWYRGPFLPDMPGAAGGVELEEWVLEQRDRFARYAARAHLDLGAQALERGDVPAAGEHGERAHGLIRDHALLEPELVQPLRRLLERLDRPLTGEVAGWYVEVGGSGSSEPSEQLVGIPSVDLVGRDEDVRRIEEALGRSRGIVTVTGAAGVGKTSIAIAIAHRAAESGQYRHGVRFVPLESVREPGDVAARLARAAGVADAADPVHAIRAALRDRSMLVILDNFEHVLAAAAFLAQIATALPGPTFLVTSRARLELSIEREIALEPLGTAEPDASGEPRAPLSPAAELFVARARRVSPSFEPSAQEQHTIEEICRRLDGLPLALELAAVHVHSFAPEDIRSMLDDRFDLLRGGYRDAPDRQRSLIAAIDWSYQLLDEEERRIFRHLAVFRGSFGVDAVVAVVGGRTVDVAMRLSTLVQHHLVQPVATSGARARFVSLETIRGYAERRLGQAGERREAEIANAKRLADLAETHGATRPAGELDREADNLRGALAFCRDEGHTTLGRRITRHTWRFWLERGDLREARTWLEAFAPPASRDDRQLSAARDAPEVGRPRVDGAEDDGFELRRALSTVLHELGEFVDSRQVLEELLEATPRGAPRRARLEIDLAWVYTHLGDLDAAEEAASRAAARVDPEEDPHSGALVENNLGWIDMYRGEHIAALERFERSAGLRARAGDARGRAFAEVNAAWSAGAGVGVFGLSGSLPASAPRPSGVELAEAIDRCIAAERELRALGDAQVAAWASTVHVELLTAAGRAYPGEERLERLLNAWRAVGNADGLALAYEAKAGARLLVGDAEGAAEAARESLGIRDRTGNGWGRARVRIQLALAARAGAHPDAALRWLEEAATIAGTLGHRWLGSLCRELADDRRRR